MGIWAGGSSGVRNSQNDGRFHEEIDIYKAVRSSRTEILYRCTDTRPG